MPSAPDTTPEPKASRVRVWQACDRVLRSGRRPTIEGIREVLGGGSPNSVTAYINDWYRELGSRLAASETPLAGFPPEAVSLMTELWRLAAGDQSTTTPGAASDDTASRMMAAEREALKADALALKTLNQELQRHRSTVEKSLAEARALLTRREAALEEERSRSAGLEQALAQARLEVEVLLERRRLAPTRQPTAPTRRKPKRPQRASARSATKSRGVRRQAAKGATANAAAKRKSRRGRPRGRS